MSTPREVHLIFQVDQKNIPLACEQLWLAASRAGIHGILAISFQGVPVVEGPLPAEALEKVSEVVGKPVAGRPTDVDVLAVVEEVKRLQTLALERAAEITTLRAKLESFEETTVYPAATPDPVANSGVGRSGKRK